ncbi:hypothetical protein BKA01_008056 [Pseudonocardia eucalypti]|uniref:hypothetical protein n=1 Tax=Pseudonocardia eucalypti TaxID=648755 RepID=UPI00161975F7|nr:hypothetical protein [Pseudonocardia eucalypti]MBB6380779.1 hypothetical protein [Pseudonocardia eucalypti]
MDDEPALVRAAPDADLAACWPLLAIEVGEWAERLALATVVATVDPAEGLAAAWAGATMITRAARALGTLGPVDATRWEHARPCASAVVRALSVAPSLPDAGRLVPDRTRWTTPHPGHARPSRVDQGRPIGPHVRRRGGDTAAADNTRTGLVMLCRHLTRVLSVLALRARCPADRAAAADAAGHAEGLAAALCAVSAPPTPAPLARAHGLRPASLPPAA